jgi:2-keto-4-pentenoate hydratase/2-oxohepta-3-ene-1,7-dioic acid hydratase in catechol pathway
MRVLRVRYQDQVFYGALHQAEAEGQEAPQLFIQCLNRELGIEGPIPLQQCAVLPPVVPTKIICLAVNYRAHAAEMGHAIPEEPVLFLKAPSAVIGSGQPIVLPRMSQRVDFEGELAIVLGKVCRRVAVEDIPSHIFGYSCANDVTARDLQKRDGQYGRAKGFDSFAPVGPWIETEVADPDDLTLRTTVNGELHQEGNTSDMVFSPFEIVSRISQVMTLFPGDVILTGTPPGVGALAPGDEVRVEIESVGTLINPVVAEADLLEESPPDSPLQ